MSGVAGRRDAHFVEGVVACPRCGNGVLEAVSDGEETNLLCHRCWSCWYWELGFLSPISVATCPGCHHRPECLRRHEEAAREADRGTGEPAGEEAGAGAAAN